LKILFVVPKFPLPVRGGLEKQSFVLAKELVRAGHDVSVFSGHFSENQLDFQDLDGVKVHRPAWLEYNTKQGGKIKFRSSIAAFFKLRSFLSALGSFDLVHVHSNSTLTGMVIDYFAGLGVPVISKIPNFGPRGVLQKMASSRGRKRLEILKKSAAAVVLVPESQEELLEIGFPQERIIHIPNGIELPVNLTQINHRSLNEPIRFVFAGRLTKEKGVVELLKAWALIIKDKPALGTLTIYGDGPLRDEIPGMIDSLGLKDTVIIAGYAPNLLSELSKFNILINPSYCEGNSNVILEAMSIGLPVCASNLSGNRIQLGTCSADCIFPPGDIDAMAKRVNYLAEDHKKLNDVSDYLFARTKSVFDMRKIAERYCHAYELIVSKQSMTETFEFDG